MFKWLGRLLFGDELSEFPPAGSGRSGDWDEKTFNQRLVKAVGKERSEEIREADMTSKAKYDEMDGHIKQLNDLRDQIREHVKRKKARAAAQP